MEKEFCLNPDPNIYNLSIHGRELRVDDHPHPDSNEAIIATSKIVFNNLLRLNRNLRIGQGDVESLTFYKSCASFLVKKCVDSPKKDLEIQKLAGRLIAQINSAADNQRIAIDLAQELLIRDPSLLAENIHNLKIEDQNVLIDLARQLLKTNPSNLANNIDKFKIQDQKVLRDLALPLINDNLRWILFTKNIDKFKIHDQAILHDFASIFLLRAPRVLLSHIEGFKIDDQKILEDLARTMVKINPEELAKNIHKLKIDDQKILEDLARAMVKINPEELAKNIHKLKIDDQKVLDSLAMDILTKDPSVFLKHIDNFKIHDQDLLSALAKKLLLRNPYILARNIDKFKLVDQELLIELIMDLANNFIPFAEHLDKFAIHDQKKITTLALFLAEKNPDDLFKNIDKFKIDDNMVLAEIGQILAKKKPSLLITNPIVLAESIETFQINSQTKINLFIMFCADNPENRNNLKEIEKINFNPSEKICVLLSLAHLNIMPLSAVHDDLAIWLKSDSLIGKNVLNFTESDFFEGGNPNFDHLDKSGKLASMNKELSAVIELGDYPQDFSEILAHLSKEENPAILFKKLLFIIYCIASSEVNDVTIDNNILTTLLNYPDPNARFFLVNTVISNHKEQKLKEEGFAEANKVKNAGQERIGKENPAASKSRSSLATKPHKIEDETTHPHLHILSMLISDPKKLKHFLSGRKKMLKDAAIFKPILDTIKILSEKKYKDTFNLIYKILNYNKSNRRHNKSSIKNTLFIIQSITEFEDFEQEIEKLDLNKNFEDLFKKNLPDICRKHSPEDFEASFGRNVLAYIMIYTSKLKQLKEPEELLLFGTFLNSVIDGSFHEQRYDSQYSPHLHALYSTKKGLKEAWMRGDELILKEQIPSGETLVLVNSDDPIDLFLCGSSVKGSCQKIDGDPELNRCLLSYLMDGKIRLLAIKKNGKVIARSLLRLLIDQRTEQPVLMLEQIYPDVLIEDLKTLINEFAIKQAKELQLPLFRKGLDQSIILESRGGRAPFEYVDAGSGFNESRYVITKTERMYTP